MKYQIFVVFLFFAVVSALEPQYLSGAIGESIIIPPGLSVVNITVDNGLGPLLTVYTETETNITVTYFDWPLAPLPYVSPLLSHSGFMIETVTVTFTNGSIKVSTPPITSAINESQHVGLLMLPETILEINGAFDKNTKRFTSFPLAGSSYYPLVIAALDNSNSYATSIRAVYAGADFADAIACMIEKGQTKTFHFLSFDFTISIRSPSVNTTFIAENLYQPTDVYTGWKIVPHKSVDPNLEAILTWKYDTSLNVSTISFAKFDDSTQKYVFPTSGRSVDLVNGIISQRTTSLFGQWVVVGDYVMPTMETFSSDSTDVSSSDVVSSSPSTTETVNGDTSDEDFGSNSTALVSSFALIGVAVILLSEKL